MCISYYWQIFECVLFFLTQNLCKKSIAELGCYEYGGQFWKGWINFPNYVDEDYGKKPCGGEAALNEDDCKPCPGK